MPCVPRMDFGAHAIPFPHQIAWSLALASSCRRPSLQLGNHSAVAACSAVIAIALDP